MATFAGPQPYEPQPILRVARAATVLYDGPGGSEVAMLDRAARVRRLGTTIKDGREFVRVENLSGGGEAWGRADHFTHVAAAPRAPFEWPGPSAEILDGACSLADVDERDVVLDLTGDGGVAACAVARHGALRGVAVVAPADAASTEEAVAAVDAAARVDVLVAEDAVAAALRGDVALDDVTVVVLAPKGPDPSSEELVWRHLKRRDARVRALCFHHRPDAYVARDCARLEAATGDVDAFLLDRDSRPRTRRAAVGGAGGARHVFAA